MNNQNTQQRYLSSDDILVTLNENSSNSHRVRDINHKLNALEENLAILQGRLGDINSQVETGYGQLKKENTDITSRVSETYRQLGELNDVYRGLSVMSVKIEQEVKALSNDIKEISEQSESEVFRLSENYEHLAVRVSDLTENVKSTTRQLSESIRVNTQSLAKLGHEMVSEIRTLANTTSRRDAELASGIDKTELKISEHRARILQLQSVDQTIIKRTQILEQASDELVTNVTLLHASTLRLDRRTVELKSAIASLQHTMTEHDGLLSGLAENAAIMHLTLHRLSKATHKNFKWLTLGLLIFVLLVAGLFGFQHSVDEETMADVSHRAEVVDQVLTSLNDQHQNSRTDIVELNEKLDNNLATLDDRLKSVDDKVASLNGRLSYAMPSTEYGTDSTLHGPAWLARQNAEGYAIRVASTPDIQALHTLVQRYRHYFKGELAYFPAQTQYGVRYFLVYTGFTNRGEAEGVLWRMPRYIESQQPVISTLQEIQQFL